MTWRKSERILGDHRPRRPVVIGLEGPLSGENSGKLSVVVRLQATPSMSLPHERSQQNAKQPVQLFQYGHSVQSLFARQPSRMGEYRLSASAGVDS